MATDVIIILGSAPNKDKSISAVGKSRVDFAIKLYKKNPNSKIITSGAYSWLLNKDPGYREAEIVKNYLIANSIDEDSIITEKKYRDTFGNALFTKPIIEKQGWKKIAIVSSKFHLKKTKYLFENIYGGGYKISYHSPSEIIGKNYSKNYPKEKKK